MSSHFGRNPQASESLGLVADWTHALNDNGELSDVLKRLMRLVKADTVMILRVSKADKRARYVARCDAQAGKIWPGQPRSYAETVIGECLPSARAGSIWKMSDTTASDASMVLSGAESLSADLAEVIVSPLEAAGGHADYVELHFRHRPAAHDLNLLVMLLDTFAMGWKRRVPGTISKRLKQIRRFTVIASDGDHGMSILDAENPAKLSRCEFRVCTLLKEGMTVKLIADTLSIGPTTVRSHLSSIFSKTGVSSQVELLHQLNRQSGPSGGAVPEKNIRVGQV
ncbi:helix-turn-helix transcriptional regulator [Roseovarius sp. PS-C2]|uniref:helix-turn-helix transcriptional regulator n=1 Tax=Roseovarius sp. PS-C2 TaxID=2820814 RepID=UPI001C0E3160|nr:helix-turn-helix transcriptional regulator [Roseovarius sp. PS-C2]MBU3261949.1 helix-turn-helix transcriptional regulator [Roseovarius sp. PS-C2]